jgi:molybdopterin-guanine dinucleotide biosynthesis protein A
MGRPKEGTPMPDGRTMIECVIAAMRGAGVETIVIVGECRGWRPPEGDSAIHLIPDRRPGMGPLAGIEAALASGPADSLWLVAACDQPLLTPEIFKTLIKGGDANLKLPVFIRVESGDSLDPFPALIPAGWLPEVALALDEGRRSVRDLIRQTGAAWVVIPDSLSTLVRSINTPEALEELRDN